MISNIDWFFLKRTLIVFVVSILLAVTFVVLGINYEQSKMDNYNKAKSSLSSAHSKYKKLVEDIDLLAQYTIAYDGYKSSGLLGGERRLSWIETLEKVNEKLKLPSLTYSLMPQEAYKSPGLKVEQNVLVNSTPMNLKMDLLHEEDLFSVTKEIRDSISNLFTLESCDISRRTQSNAPLNTKKANFISDCLIRWITVDVK